MRLAPRWQECPRCVAARQSIFQKIFFLRSIDVRDVELPALDEAEAVEDWETDGDVQVDEMDEM